jgi:hypothetical protein
MTPGGDYELTQHWKGNRFQPTSRMRWDKGMLHGSFSTGKWERGHPEHVWECIKSIWDGLKYWLNIFHTILACIPQLWKYIGLVLQNCGKTPFQLVRYHHVPYWNDKCLGWSEIFRNGLDIYISNNSNMLIGGLKYAYVQPCLGWWFPMTSTFFRVETINQEKIVNHAEKQIDDLSNLPRWMIMYETICAIGKELAAGS